MWSRRWPSRTAERRCVHVCVCVYVCMCMCALAAFASTALTNLCALCAFAAPTMLSSLRKPLRTLAMCLCSAMTVRLRVCMCVCACVRVCVFLKCCLADPLSNHGSNPVAWRACVRVRAVAFVQRSTCMTC